MSSPMGGIHFEWQGNTLIRLCRDVRRALIYWTYVAADVLTSHMDDALAHVLLDLNNMQPATEYFGLLNRNG
eukprot:343803-Prorocentrum_lima.AAC.1